MRNCYLAKPLTHNARYFLSLGLVLSSIAFASAESHASVDLPPADELLMVQAKKPLQTKVDVTLSQQNTVSLELERENPFADDSAFLIGAGNGEIESVRLFDATYYRGSVIGHKNSYAFLSLGVNGKLAGFIKLGENLWGLSSNQGGDAIVGQKMLNKSRSPLRELGDDITRPSHTPVEASKLRTISGFKKRSGFTNFDCGILEINETKGFNLSDNAICVLQAAVPSGGTASFTLTSESGDADLAIQRVSDSEIVCESNNSAGVDTCYISEAGDYEVLMIAERASTSFVTYSINAEELPTGAHFEVNVAVDIDYALFEQFGTLENLQSYLAALFAYNNVTFEREVRTKLLIGQIRARTTASDDPYHSAEDLGSDCRLAEFSEKWHSNNTLRNIDRGLATHLTNINFGGRANLGGLCQASFTFPAQSIPSCPFQRRVSGDFSVNGVYGVTPNSGEQNLWDNDVTSHEFGHNLNSEHTHCYAGTNGISQNIDNCYAGESSCWAGAETLPGLNSVTNGTQGARNGTIMSYCHLLGADNIAATFGQDHPYGVAAHRVPDVMRNYVGGIALAKPDCVATVYPDTDGDGFTDDIDTFPQDPDEWSDQDNDGVGDNSDAFPTDPSETLDSDGDGVGDNQDAFPTDPSEAKDTDGDGIGDNADPTPNGDSGIDSDNDGFTDEEEIQEGTSPTDPNDYPIHHSMMVKVIALGLFESSSSGESVSLSINIEGSGIVALDDGRSCSQSCTISVDSGSSVILNATPSTGYIFKTWTGACSGDAASCQLPLSGSTEVGAVFDPVWTTLTYEFPSINEGQSFVETFVLPETASTLEVFMSGGDDGDADLYVSSISYYNANAETWQCFPLLNMSEESCVTDDLLPLDPGGAYAVGVLGYTAVTGVSVLVRYK